MRRRNTSTSSDPASSAGQPDRVALAILLVDGRYLLQLRDDNPNIEAPGIWSLFGGGVRDHEDPEAALVREVREELSVRLGHQAFLWTMPDPDTARSRTFFFFEADATREWRTHRLREGQDARCFEPGELAALPMPHLIRAALERHALTRRPPSTLET